MESTIIQTRIQVKTAGFQFSFQFKVAKIDFMCDCGVYFKAKFLLFLYQKGINGESKNEN